MLRAYEFENTGHFEWSLPEPDQELETHNKQIPYLYQNWVNKEIITCFHSRSDQRRV